MIAQTTDDPEIEPGCDGIDVGVTARVWAVLLPQTLSAVIEMFPDALPEVALIDVVVEEPVHPVGSVHVYETAPLTAEIPYVPAVPAQIVVLPLMVPGCAGTEETMVTESD